MPCGHAAYCVKCSQNLKSKCSICNETIVCFVSINKKDDDPVYNQITELEVKKSEEKFEDNEIKHSPLILIDHY